MSKPRVGCALIVAIALFFQGCASQSGFSQSFSKRLTETQSSWYYRNRVSNQNLSRPIVWTPQQIMEHLIYVSPLRGHHIPVIVINDPKVNAQTDGSAIFINSGLVNLFGSDTDLVASVFAHELGHILANHHKHGLSGGSSLNYIGYLTPALGLLPYGGYYGNAATTAVREGVKMRQFSYSRNQENEADAIGAWIAQSAGFNAMGLSEFLEYTGGGGFGTPKNISIPTSVGAIPQSAAVTLLSASPLYQTHPPSKKRKRIVRLMIARKKGEISQEQLRKEAGWLADLYQTLELRSPKSFQL